MKINNLSLKNFRNYLDLDIEFNDKLNIIIGNNAQGKTNILESIYFLSITKSFLPVHEKMLINKNEEYLFIKGEVETYRIKKKLSVLLNKNGKKLEINKKEIKRNIDYLGNLKIILFSPDDLRILRESPGNRRRFLNIELSQLYDKYVKLLSSFNIVLKQRNEYLKFIKDNKCNEEYFNIINEKYVDLSVSIYKYRYEFINDINNYIGSKYEAIAGEDGLKIKYICDVLIDNEEIMYTDMLKKLEDIRNREIMYGSSIIGPHKDNFSFYLKDNDLSMYGSQGQLKMAILSLKLSEIDVFSKICNESPVLLLDDIFSELDIDKRNRLVEFLNNDIQTIMTTTDLSEIDQNLVDIANIYIIDNGKLIEKVSNN